MIRKERKDLTEEEMNIWDDGWRCGLLVGVLSVLIIGLYFVAVIMSVGIIF